jgi:ribA/ribD-fused uncharacterized protein
MDAVKGFRGDYSFLSNFYPSPFYLAGDRYLTGEHAFQCMKTRSEPERILIQMQRRPADAKRIGREVTLRPDWESVKAYIMYKVVFEKFNQNPPLLNLLFRTGDAMLYEVNTWGDTYWGVNPQGEGSNTLGLILMRARAELHDLGPQALK